MHEMTGLFVTSPSLVVKEAGTLHPGCGGCSGTAMAMLVLCVMEWWWWWMEGMKWWLARWGRLTRNSCQVEEKCPKPLQV